MKMSTDTSITSASASVTAGASTKSHSDDTDNEWSLSALEKPFLFGQFTWTTSDVKGKNLFAAQLSLDTLFPVTADAHYLSPIGWYLRKFGYCKFDLKFTINLSSSSFHAGKLIVYWDPDGDIQDQQGATFRDHQIIDVAKTKEINLIVSFHSGNNWIVRNITQNAFNMNGLLGICVYQPLVLQTQGTSRVPVTIRLTPINYSARFPMGEEHSLTYSALKTFTGYT